MNLSEMQEMVVSEICRMYTELKLCGEEDIADELATNGVWRELVRNYPDLTAEEIASAVCGGLQS